MENKMFLFLCVWAVYAALTVWLCGLGWLKLGNLVLVSLVGSLAVTVFVFVGFLARKEGKQAKTA